MMRGPKANVEQQERGTMPSTAVKQALSTERYFRIEVAGEERAKLWKVISENKWSGEYLGKNVFVFTAEQLNRIKEAGISFRDIDQ
jgi:hypothetical protein